ncbi:MAG: hypothetical protein DBY30_00695 [Verrucomicrobia bacterium]|nr:MAG: hypothetical protein DBY30_00695 [Verrucomicrobiota bacterium]
MNSLKILQNLPRLPEKAALPAFPVGKIARASLRAPPESAAFKTARPRAPSPPNAGAGRNRGSVISQNF